ncbi:anthrax toxin receptor-like isoform X4 [Mastomys coucha]|uniref:anthrax toxin receptor-like isoform X4 n=1 Tax=Mastomys coucha TaxID=35658 RepID=UPI0012622A04|nr:anthrax toxin receptor-like isoform X4 [Mastomys coucha]
MLGRGPSHRERSQHPKSYSKVPGTVKNMTSHSPCMPCSALFLLLLLLLPPTFKGGSLRYHGPGWKLFHRLNKGFRSPHQRQIQQMRQNVPQGQSGNDCQGIFDLYLILDKSGSVAENWIYIYSFAEGLVKKFTNPNLRISIITYATEAEVILPLTSDRNEINKSLIVLKNIEPQGLTHMQKGLRKANEQIRKSTLGGRNINSVIIALTDGLLLLKPYIDTMEEAKKARKMGAILYTVGVFMYSRQQLVSIAGDPDHCFGVDEGFTALEGIVNPLASKSCTEVLSVQPTYVCAKDSYQVNISGHGFNNTNNMKQVICRFTFSDSRVVDESPSDVNENSITCPGPKIQHTGEDVSLQVSLNNGISFIGNKLIITSTNCWSTRASQRATFNWTWLMFLPVLLVTLLLLCCSWKLCIKPKEPPPPPSPPPQPEKAPEEESPPESPPAPSPAPSPASPPAPLPVNTNPTVIVACCGCGNRGMQGNLDKCCSYFYPNCHQMPLVWCHPKVQGRCPSFTVMNPSCSRASRRQKLCPCSNRDYFHLAEPPYPTRIVLQPNEECFNITQPCCSPNIRFQTGQQSLPVAQTLCSKICSPPSQEQHTFNSPQPSSPVRYTKSPARMLPLLPPHTRQSVESLCHTYPFPPISKGLKF